MRKAEQVSQGVRRFQIIIQCTFTAATVILVIAALKLFQSGLNIDTNLRSLAPHIAQDPQSEALIHHLSSAASRKALVILAAEDPATVTAASDLLRTRTAALAEDKNSLVRVADSADTVEQYVRLLETFPYNFLSPSASSLLSTVNGLSTANGLSTVNELSSSDETRVTQWVLEKLYSGTSQVRLTGFDRDPFGVLNDYALSIQESLSANAMEDVRSVIDNGVELNIAVWQFDLPEDGMALDTQTRWIDEIARIEVEIVEQFPGVQWLKSGMIFFAADSAQSAQKNITAVSNFGAFGIILLMLVIFRGMRPLAGSLLSILGGVGFAFVVCHSVWNSLHILTLLFGASLIGVAVDYSLHLYYFHLEKKPASGSVHRQHFYRALLLSLLTSIVGYGALAMSGLDTLRQVALFSIAGLIYACLLVLVLESWSTKKVTARDVLLTAFTRGGVDVFSNIGRVQYLAAFAAIIWMVIFALGQRLTFDDSPKAFIKPNSQLFDNERIVNEWVGDYEPATFVLIRGGSDQDVFDKIARLNAQLIVAPKALGGPGQKLLGIHSFLPSPSEQLTYQALNGALYANDKLSKVLVDEYEIIDRDHLHRIQTAYHERQNNVLTPLHLQQQISGFPQLWIENANAHDKKSIVTALLVPKSASLEELRQVTQNLPDTELISMVKQTEDGLRSLRKTASYYLAFALMLIGGIFFWRYGWRRAIVLSLVPVSVLGCIGLVYLVVQVPITLFHVMAAFLVVGLGVDYLVFAAEMVGDADTSNHFANALVLSAVTSTLSFGLLSLTVLPAVQAFGMTAMLGILGNLLGAFWLIAIWRRKQQS